MTAFLIISIIGVWFLLAAVFVVTSSMMSARLSHLEEGSNRMADAESTAARSIQGNRSIPTQPRVTSAH